MCPAPGRAHAPRQQLPLPQLRLPQPPAPLSIPPAAPHPPGLLAWRGQVLLLFEGADVPPAGAEPDESLLLHGCKAELPEEEEEEGFELSIADSQGEVFSLCLADAAARQEWKEALESRSAPPAIARASHILIKHQGSRRLASWRDPDGKEIAKRTEAAATKQLLSCARPKPARPQSRPARPRCAHPGAALQAAPPPRPPAPLSRPTRSWHGAATRG